MKTTTTYLICLNGVLLLNVNTALPASYADAVLADGPIAYYRFSDAPPVATNSGSLGAAVNGFYTNGATAGVEAPRPPDFPGFEADNTALQLDGTDDFVGTVSGLLNGLTNVSVSGWLRRNGAQNDRTGLFGQNDLIEFGYIDNNTLQLWIDDFTTPVNVTPNPFPDAQWSHVAFTLNGAQMKVYTNGLLAGTAALTSANYGTNAFPFNIGGGGIFDAITNNGNYFNGQIDEVAVFDKELTAEQIAAQYFSTIASPPIITEQPQTTNVFEGANVVLSVGVTGPGPFFYQWLDFGNPIPGQTNSTLSFTNITINQGSTFSVVVTNAFGMVESALADIIVSPATPPVITREPVSITRYAGATAVLSVEATGGSQLQYQWQTVSMGNGSDLAGATNSSLVISNVQPADAGDYRVIVSNSSGSTTSMVATITVITNVPGSYADLIVSCNPLAYWRLNETNGDIAFDYAGGHDAIYVNPAGVPGIPPTGPEAPRAPQFPGLETNNLAAQFDGATIYVNGPTGLLNGLVNVSTVGWIRRAADQPDRTGVFGQNDLIEFGYIDNNTLQLWIDDFTTPVNVTPNPFPDTEWSHVAFTLDGTQMKVYTNGSLAGTAALPSSNYGSNSFAFNIGGGGVFDDSGNFFNGQIDEVAVFDQTLTSDKICALYLRATGKQVVLSISPTGNIVLDTKPVGTEHDGANFGATWIASDIDNNFITRTGVMQFAAIELDQITLASDPDFNSPTGTITFWIRSASTAGAGDFGAILFDRRSNRGDVIVQADDGTIFVQANDGSGTVNSFNTTATVSDNVWHNIAYVYDQAGATTVYIDGVVAGTQTTTRPWSWDPAQQIELGRSHDPFWKAFDGTMDDFRIYNRLLTVGEIQQIVNSDALVDTNALKVRFNFDSPPSGVTISWVCGTLQCTDELVGNGPGTVWTDVPTASPPYVVNPLSAPARFYRVKY